MLEMAKSMQGQLAEGGPGSPGAAARAAALGSGQRGARGPPDFVLSAWLAKWSMVETSAPAPGPERGTVPVVRCGASGHHVEGGDKVRTWPVHQTPFSCVSGAGCCEGQGCVFCYAVHCGLKAKVGSGLEAHQVGR